MSSRRIPLGDVPNAANSPARQHTHLKRPREQIEAQENFSLNVVPNAKRQALDPAQLRLRLSPSKAPQRPRDDRPERRLQAVKDASHQQRITRHTDVSQEGLVDVRKWQLHYRKVFPDFVFYFEGLAEDVRMRWSKVVRNLGAREEKFFSKNVTHVVTNRSLPTQTDGKTSFNASSAPVLSQNSSQTRTINPSLLDKSHDAPSIHPPMRAKFDFDARIRKVPHAPQRDQERSKASMPTNDLLLKAQDLGIRIWQLQKLERIVNMINEPSLTQEHVSGMHNANKPPVARAGRDVELSRLIKNEQIRGPSDRAASTRVNELVPFKGPYLLIRDMDEITRPIMFREWSKPQKKGDTGEWPQFRATSQGKCPFVEEISREELEKEMARQEALAKQQKAQSGEQSHSRPVSRAATPQVIYEDEDTDSKDERQNEQSSRKPLQEIQNPRTKQREQPEKPPVPKFCPTPAASLPHQARSPRKDTVSREDLEQQKPMAYEPAASGVQPSNITSAIRSQVISSTTGVPLVKAGMSKEVHGLKRKVLEKNSGSSMNVTQARPQPIHMPSGRAEAQICRARQGRAQSKEVLNRIEESATTEGEEDIWLAEDVRTKNVPPKAKNEKGGKKDGKIGYCENCREKYEEFDEHIQSRRHRKFAINNDNWKDLDKLLAKLVRPLRSDGSGGF